MPGSRALHSADCREAYGDRFASPSIISGFSTINTSTDLPSTSMPVIFVRATYSAEMALLEFFCSLSGCEATAITWTRGLWKCTIPRPLSQDENAQLQEVAAAEHYSQR
ncbi:hypothetical protein F5X99DRAFT_375776 [Biscogniauxia marginata]|nr:hypothetical protein F5X99DRAFT_375776 [Biscogniauxia marginata]